ncbi:MAG: valine--tRNA ligase [Acidobacteria bacterium]|jgi:valyl-tRNA synthetase|nr:valine--tRNA ligase [Acidobacteriota bacterium]
MEKSYDHLQTESDWYRRWEEQGLFTPEAGSAGSPFSIILPPPNVTGSLHIGHALTLSLPDIIVRRKKMLGFNVLWLPGVDHAGIATQMMVEKNLKKETGRSKEDLGRERFLQMVWDWKNASEQRIVGQIKKLGLALDWSRMKFTLSDEMQRVVRKVFVALYREGKIYQGTYMVNRCPSCKTVLSDLEVEHKEVHGRLTYIRYPLRRDPKRWVVVATTRPETMLGDVAVAVHPKDARYKKLIGQDLLLPLTGRAIPIVGDEDVDKDFGTGAVKVTPAHDPADFKIALKHRLEKIVVIDEQARMTGPIPEKFAGLDRFACRQGVLNDLRALGLVEKEEEYTHNVGHCQRCETVVEPNISKQWFLKTAELAPPAIAAVRDGEIAFIPDKWKKVYFNWMENIQDWCISRQLWWGHRIPAFHCQDCQQVLVSEEDPERCPGCSGTRLVQDPDVLDTWFSSALWPFTTLGWQDDSPDFKTFYPTSIMSTGFDIIFFWVARMIMMGVHFGKAVPFREVLINGLIRDEKGQKMSKTKNNAVDPLDIIREYGADALRFTLAIQAVPGMDISLSLSRIKGYKAFANKIWNASRYVIMNLKDDERAAFDPRRISDADKWVLHKLNNLVEKVNASFDEYRMYEAADLIYHFIWDEYCDWYLEFSKSDLDSPDTRAVLKLTLLRILQLLHPFMPFISEEIYQKIKAEKEFLIQTSFPAFSSELAFPEAHAAVETLKKVVAETRKTRTENRIEPNKRIPIFLKCDAPAERRHLEKHLKYFDFLSRSSKTEIVADFSSLPKGFRGVSLNWEILLPFVDDTDRQRELARLRAEHDKLAKLIAQNEAKLSGGGFADKAPAEVILNFKKNLQEIIEKKAKLGKTIDDLA